MAKQVVFPDNVVLFPTHPTVIRYEQEEQEFNEAIQRLAEQYDLDFPTAERRFQSICLLYQGELKWRSCYRLASLGTGIAKNIIDGTKELP